MLSAYLLCGLHVSPSRRRHHFVTNARQRTTNWTTQLTVTFVWWEGQQAERVESRFTVTENGEPCVLITGMTGIMEKPELCVGNSGIHRTTPKLSRELTSGKGRGLFTLNTSSATVGNRT